MAERVELGPLPELPQALRESLPVEVQAYLGLLEQQVSLLRKQVEALQAQVRQSSQNSSRPPSSDPPSAPPRPKAPTSGRKRGAQPGYRGHQRQQRAEAEVDRIEEHWPRACPGCQSALPQEATRGSRPIRQQVWELPLIEPEVVEHRYQAVCCPQCARVVRAERPVGVAPGAFGPRLTSLVGLLSGRYRLSKREVSHLLLDAFGVEVSVGGVVRLTEQVSAALAAPYAEVHGSVPSSRAANVDETGWKEAGAKRWLWVAVTALSTLFSLPRTRGSVELAQLLGGEYRGIVVSDRHRAYLSLDPAQRQLCWAHLKRDLLAYSQYSGATGEWGQRALEREAQLFALWHRFRAGEIDRPTLQAEMQPVQAAFAVLLKQGADLPHRKARGFCRDLANVEGALWTFLSVEGVDPTNIAAERALRPAVLWRKGSFGSDSERGLRFVERILTVAATCRQQDRHLLAFLADAVQAHWAGQPAPSLLPAP